ncbi:hypothetical protein JTE90_018203 [Oedothorax gibbosus]|uniref:Uncharacterized protein n=1 Tax=Oedothorax gibbosus TaxID=931172 RepID=A0AAV6U8S5_9ARAC|nr:hypothetical protein JTE90_018203 [Oedothorax gibbosus]
MVLHSANADCSDHAILSSELQHCETSSPEFKTCRLTTTAELTLTGLQHALPITRDLHMMRRSGFVNRNLIRHLCRHCPRQMQNYVVAHHLVKHRPLFHALNLLISKCPANWIGLGRFKPNMHILISCCENFPYLYKLPELPLWVRTMLEERSPRCKEAKCRRAVLDALIRRLTSLWTLPNIPNVPGDVASSR